MNDTSNPKAEKGPSRATIAKGAVWTFVGAAVVTVLFILPAEYGVDPTGLGEKIGLTRLAAVSAPEMDTEPRIVEGRFPDIPAEEDFDFYEPETLGDPFSRSHDKPFRTDTILVPIDAYEQVEVKTTMKQGDALVYSWKLIDGSVVYADFHADPHQVELYPEQYWIRYQESETDSASGSIVAPFDGNHGWYWLNIEEEPIKIELTVSGYYDSIDEIMRSYQ
jgi:hypothetical protein